MRINWKKITIITLDLIIGTYLVFAFTKFNQPDESDKICTKVNINIQDEMTNGFLDAKEIKKRLEAKKIYPLEKPLQKVSARTIEETLKQSPFVKSVECYKTQDGMVDISLTQRMPIVRIKSVNKDDYYVDDHCQIMPNTKYTSDNPRFEEPQDIINRPPLDTLKEAFAIRHNAPMNERQEKMLSDLLTTSS